jgi:hypothetical protein
MPIERAAIGDSAQFRGLLEDLLVPLQPPLPEFRIISAEVAFLRPEVPGTNRQFNAQRGCMAPEFHSVKLHIVPKRHLEEG